MHLKSTFGIVRFQYKVGQIADKDIIAPFSFQVPKTSEAITKERERVNQTIEPIYQVSENRKFTTLTKIDSFIENLAVIDYQSDPEIVFNTLRSNGYNLSRESIELLDDSQVRLRLHNYLIRVFNSIMSIGIYGHHIDKPNLRLSSNGSVRQIPLSRLYSIEESRTLILKDFQDERLKPALMEIIPNFLTDNIVIDTDKTNALLQEAYKEINPVLTEVLENEEIIRKNRRIAEIDIKKLEAMYSYLESSDPSSDMRTLFLAVSGYFLFSLLFLFSPMVLTDKSFKREFNSKKFIIAYLTLIVVTVLTAFVVTKIDNAPAIILPYAFTIIIFAVIFNPLSGILFNIICLFLILPFFHWNVITLTILFSSTMTLLIIMTKMKDTHDFVPLAIYLILSFLVVASIVSLLTNTNQQDYLSYLFYGALSCVLSIAGVILLSPIVEKKLNLTNKIILLQLLETDHPLLKKMKNEIAGTFHHSITVGTLAESAAEAIGANSLLVRVASYYHDIGKLSQPEIFIENNSSASDIHNKMEFYESAVSIKNHVLSGVTLARKYKLPEQVIDIIRQHHGDSKVHYFYEKAKEVNPNEDDTKYRYFGPKPRTKEAALVMIADIIESTAKVNMNGHTEESLKKIIDNTINRLINEKQLSETPITLKELETVKSFMLPIIVGIYRKRIEYPSDEKEQSGFSSEINQTTSNLTAGNIDEVKKDSNAAANSEGSS